MEKYKLNAKVKPRVRTKKQTNRPTFLSPNISSYSVIVGALKTDPLLILHCWATKYLIPLLHQENKEKPRVTDLSDILIIINKLLNRTNNGNQ